MTVFKKHVYPLLILAIPLAIIGLLQSGVFFFETLFLAHLGPDILAAGTLVGWLFGTFTVLILGILSSINILTAHRYGANDHEGIALITRDGIKLALFLALPAFLLFWNIAPLFLVFGQGTGIVEMAQSYLHSLCWGIFPNFVAIALIEMIVGLGKARIILLFSIFGVTSNIFLSFILIFGKLGLPALGITGAGWGMAISNWIMLALLVFYIMKQREISRYFYFFLNRGKRPYLGELIQVGIPLGMIYSVEVGFYFVLTLVMGYFGSTVMAANQIALQYMASLMAVVFSIAQAVTVRMGHLLGANHKTDAGKAGYAGTIISALLMVFVAIIFWVFPKSLISIDFDVHRPENSEIVNFSVEFLKVSAFFQLIEAMRISLFGALRGLKDTHFTLFISIISFWGIALPLGYFFAINLNIGGIGLWWGMVIGASLSVVLLFWRFKVKMAMIIRTKKEFD